MTDPGTQVAYVVDPDQIAADLYGPVGGGESQLMQQQRVRPLSWAQIAPAPRMSIARRAQRVVAGHLHLPAGGSDLFDQGDLQNPDYRAAVWNIVARAAWWQENFRRSGPPPTQGQHYPQQPGPEALARAVIDGVERRFGLDMERNGHAWRASGHNGQNLGTEVFGAVRERTGLDDLARRTAEATVKGWAEAARSEPRRTAPQAGPATRDAAAIAYRLPGPRTPRSTYHGWEPPAWQAMGAQLGDLTASLEDGGDLHRTPSLAAREARNVVSDQLRLDDREVADLGDVGLLTQGRPADFMHQLIGGALRRAYPDDRLRAEVNDAVSRSFGTAHTARRQELRQRVQERERRSPGGDGGIEM